MGKQRLCIHLGQGASLSRWIFQGVFYLLSFRHRCSPLAPIEVIDGGIEGYLTNPSPQWSRATITVYLIDYFYECIVNDIFSHGCATGHAVGKVIAGLSQNLINGRHGVRVTSLGPPHRQFINCGGEGWLLIDVLLDQ